MTPLLSKLTIDPAQTVKLMIKLKSPRGASTVHSFLMLVCPRDKIKVVSTD